MKRKVLFIDRDGTLIAEPEDCQVDDVSKVRLLDGVIPALLELQEAGYRFVMVSNQDGLGTTSFPTADFAAAHEHMMRIFASQGVTFDEVFICPHLPDDGCDCRKPATGLLTKYLAATSIDIARSAVIGDRDTDMQLAEAIGVAALRVTAAGDRAESWPSIVRRLCAGDRVARVVRRTRETDIVVSVDLDSPREGSISTGIDFFDHMLEQIAKHGAFELNVACKGDLNVDEHHTVEDCAISIGNAVREALGDKRGIGRYGFLLPMDESEAQVALDLSGRSAFEFTGAFPRESVGALSTEMVEHFFRSMAESLGAALHVRVSGRNTHHMVEACFKAVGRSLRQAIKIEGDALPTTKGVLS
jgi:imidazoleglycerol-phosphate dehydratase/histidinol-phosphatase